MDSVLRQIRNTVEHTLEHIFRTIFFWTQTDHDLGLWISYVHIAMVATIGIFVLTYRILRPPFWMIAAMMFCLLGLFIQHVFLRTCILSRIERRLMGEGGWFINAALRLFGVTPTRESVLGATILCSGFCLVILISEVAGQLWHQSV
jgi:hypothetical protein